MAIRNIENKYGKFTLRDMGNGVYAFDEKKGDYLTLCGRPIALSCNINDSEETIENVLGGTIVDKVVGVYDKERGYIERKAVFMDKSERCLDCFFIDEFEIKC